MPASGAAEAARHLDDGELQGLLELCDAQTDTLRRLREALSSHRAASDDQLTIRQMLAHELRTPLCVVVGALGTLRDGKLDEATSTELLEMAHRQAVHLSEIADDIIHLTAPAELKPPRMALERVAVARVVRDACDAIRSTVDPAMLTIEVPPALLADTVVEWLRQVVSHLVVQVAGLGVPPVRVTARKVDGLLDIEVAAGARPAPPPGADDAREPGVGLYVARALARALAGSAELEVGEAGVQGREATVARVSLPQRRLSDP